MSTFQLFVLLLLFASQGSYAKTTLSIALIEIPGVLEFNNTNTPYGRLVPELFKQSNHNFEFLYLPSSRAYKMLGEGKVACIFPVVPNLLDAEQNASIISEPVNAIGAYLFTLKHSNTPLSIGSLKNKTIVYRRGYLFGSTLQNYPNIKFLPVATQSAGLGMLKKNRADALLDYLPDLKFVFSTETLATLRYDLSLPVLANYDRVRCSPTGDNKKFIQNVNANLNELRQSGKLKKVLGEYYLPVKTK